MNVSVIIPTFNNACYLPAAIDSALGQTLGPLEVIVIDDGSMDDTAEVVNRYGSRVVYVRQENQGLGAARNRGIGLVRGEAFSFLDGDDVWHERNLELKSAVLRAREELGAVFSDFYLFEAAGVTNSRAMRAHYPIFRERHWRVDEIFRQRAETCLTDGTPVHFKAGSVFTALLFGNFINACSILIRRRCQEQVGPFTDLRTQQDYEYWLRFTRSWPIAYIDLPLVGYRRHEGQLTAHPNMARMLTNVVGILRPYYERRQDLLGKRKGTAFAYRFAHVLQNLSRAQLEANDLAGARATILEAIRVWPASVRSLALMSLGLLPAGAFHAFLRVARPRYRGGLRQGPESVRVDSRSSGPSSPISRPRSPEPR